MAEHLYFNAEALAAEYGESKQDYDEQEQDYEELAARWEMQALQMQWGGMEQMFDWQSLGEMSGWSDSAFNQGGGPRATARPTGQQKQRFCATYPNVSRCRHGTHCSFAHTREEVTAPLLTPEEEEAQPQALTVEFFTQKFKTLWCPVGAQHDWQSCMYAHTYQDVRRPPSLGYGHQLCPYWNKKETNLSYSQRCPLGPRCSYAHGAKEQLYHPHYFRTLVCRDLQRRRCPRSHFCAFFHRQGDCRKVRNDPVDYTQPLSKEALSEEWLQYFLNPPRFQEATDGMEGYAVDPDIYAAAMANAMLPMGLPFSKYHVEGQKSPRTESTAVEDDHYEDLDASSNQGASSRSLLGMQAGHNEDSWTRLAQGGQEDSADWGTPPYYSAFGVYPGYLMASEKNALQGPTKAPAKIDAKKHGSRQKRTKEAEALGSGNGQH